MAMEFFQFSFLYNIIRNDFKCNYGITLLHSLRNISALNITFQTKSSKHSYRTDFQMRAPNWQDGGTGWKE